MSKRLSRWDHRLQIQNLFFMAFKRGSSPMVVTLGQQYNTGEKPTVMLYTYIFPPVLLTCPLHANSGCRKERRILLGPW